MLTDDILLSRNTTLKLHSLAYTGELVEDDEIAVSKIQAALYIGDKHTKLIILEPFNYLVALLTGRITIQYPIGDIPRTQ